MVDGPLFRQWKLSSCVSIFAVTWSPSLSQSRMIPLVSRLHGLFRMRAWVLINMTHISIIQYTFTIDFNRRKIIKKRAIHNQSDHWFTWQQRKPYNHTTITSRLYHQLNEDGGRYLLTNGVKHLVVGSLPLYYYNCPKKMAIKQKNSNASFC